MNSRIAISEESVINKIHLIRGQKVLLDSDPSKADKFSRAL